MQCSGSKNTPHLNFWLRLLFFFLHHKNNLNSHLFDKPAIFISPPCSVHTPNSDFVALFSLWLSLLRLGSALPTRREMAPLSIPQKVPELLFPKSNFFLKHEVFLFLFSTLVKSIHTSCLWAKYHLAFPYSPKSNQSHPLLSKTETSLLTMLSPPITPTASSSLVFLSAHSLF